MKRVASRHNPIFKRVREALRDHDREIVIEGPKAVSDAIHAGWEPITIISREEPAVLHERGVVFTAEVFDALTETKSPQNVIGLFQRPEGSLEEIAANAEKSVIVALDAVQDPGNVGTIVRLAAAFEAAGVLLLGGCADPFGPKAIRASAGAVLSVPIVRSSIDELLALRLPVYAADARGDATSPPSRQAIVVFGSEGVGLSREISAVAQPLRVPISERVESLNVAASAAILLSQCFNARS